MRSPLSALLPILAAAAVVALPSVGPPTSALAAPPAVAVPSAAPLPSTGTASALVVPTTATPADPIHASSVRTGPVPAGPVHAGPVHAGHVRAGGVRAGPAAPSTLTGPGPSTTPDAPRLVRVLGTVASRDGARPMVGVRISLPEAEVATETHSNGGFILLIPDAFVGRELEIVAEARGYEDASGTFTVEAPESEVELEMERAPEPEPAELPPTTSGAEVAAVTPSTSTATASATRSGASSTNSSTNTSTNSSTNTSAASTSTDPTARPRRATLHGVVRGADGTPLPDVTVLVDQTGFGAVTDERGRYWIQNVPPGERTLRAVLIGYGEERATVTVPDGGSVSVDFTLHTQAVELEGMVVTGSAVAAQRREVGNSIALVTSEDIRASGASSLNDVLRGQARGLTVSGRGNAQGAAQRMPRGAPRSTSPRAGDPTGPPSAPRPARSAATRGLEGVRQLASEGIDVRGLSSLNGRNRPLIYLDGVRLGETAARLDSLDPSAIDRIEIIKGAAAQTLYGPEAYAGVIQIFTKAGASASMPAHHPLEFDRESYEPIVENDFLDPRPDPLSTFSIDVDRASYANTRRFVTGGSLPPAGAVRIEELINYFDYSNPAPGPEGPPFRVTTEVAPAPWAPDHRLVRIGLKAREIDLEEAPPSNLVFLLDVSGSMQPPNKLPLLKQAMEMLVGELRPQDRVAIVVYAGAAGLVLESTPGDRGDRIRAALRELRAGGSTAGGAGIELAYRIAADNYIEGGNNRVILATDGDFNVGPSSDAAMVELIEAKREQGTFLTVLGFGTGNLQDAKMEKIADHGNGNFHYIDGRREAEKVLVREMGGTLFTVAKDVKIQVEFNPARVQSYRLIGYENRLLEARDFADDTKDAGELGAGHTVTALYEVVPVGVDAAPLPETEALRYQAPRPEGPPPLRDDELLYVKLRWKEPTSRTSERIDHPVYVEEAREDASEDLRFAAAVAAWGMLLRGSEHCGDFTLEDVAALARGALGIDPNGDRAEFLGLVWQSLRLQERVALRQELQREWSRRRN